MTTSDKTLDWYTIKFEREFKDARAEFLRLSQLFQEAIWYNFEVNCRKWKGPWRGSAPESLVAIQGMSFVRKWNKGQLIEYGEFPDWYRGPVHAAPPLPPIILLHEMKQARAYMEACEKQVTAPYDWAPGGCLYESLRRTTLVGHCELPWHPRNEVILHKKRKFSSSNSSDGGG